MVNTFSFIKSLKVGLTSLALAGSFLLANTASAQYFRTSGTQILDPVGKPVFFNGTNLGNWLVWEGYMMMNDFKYRTHTQLLNSIQTVLGDAAKAKGFERQWRLNYVTQQSIDELVSLGYNSVRVPFNYKLFWNDATNSPSNEGFEYINNLVNYCRGKGIYILLDMHGAPGYQNPADHSDNVDSNARHPQSTVHFLDNTTATGAIGANVAKAALVWKHIANYYKNEPVIWGYDLLNEPQTGGQAPALVTAYRHMRDAIRLVDSDHIIVVEGDNWAGWMYMFDGTPIDSNLVLETHHYVFGDTTQIAQLNDRAAYADSLNVPIIIGEIGEDTESILRQMADIGKAKYDGVFSWSFKKMYRDRTLWTITPDASKSKADAAYVSLVNAINSRKATTLSASTYTDLLTFANTNIRNGAPRLQWWQNFYDATKNP